MKTLTLILSSLFTLATLAAPATAHADDGGADGGDDASAPDGGDDAGPDAGSDAGSDAGADASVCQTDALCLGKSIGDPCGEPGAGGGCSISHTGTTCTEPTDASTLPLFCQLILEPSEDAGGDASGLGGGEGGTGATPTPTVGCVGKSAGDACLIEGTDDSAFCFATDAGLTCAHALGGELPDAGTSVDDTDGGGCNLGGAGGSVPFALIALGLLVPVVARRRKGA
jgi:hypothetical protein